MAQQPRVFISYARSDGLPFSRRLRTWLEKKKIPLFQDLVSLTGGRTSCCKSTMPSIRLSSWFC